jgi:alpha-N-acetylglucosamine transferase
VSAKNIKHLKHPSLIITDIRLTTQIPFPPTAQPYNPRWVIAANKLRLWELTEYEKILYMDTDVVVLQSIEHFFQYPHLSSSRNMNEECRIHNADGTLIKTDRIGGINAGVVVLQPSQEEFDAMIALLNNGEKWRFSEQDILQRYYTQIDKSNFIPLEESAFIWCPKAPWWDWDKLKTCHFTHTYLNYKFMMTATLDDVKAYISDPQRSGAVGNSLPCYEHWLNAWSDVSKNLNWTQSTYIM